MSAFPRAALALFVLLPALAQDQAIPPRAPAAGELLEAPFRVLDNVEGAHVDLLLAPVRPLLAPQAGRLWALSTHDSRLVEVDAASGARLRVLPMPWGPVALARWTHGGAPGLLVACRGTHALVHVDEASGRTVGLIPLPHEPADVVVHASSGHAFVSCSGAGVVAEVDVAARAVVATHPIASKEPTFLALHGERVLVAPMSSGNDSLAETGGGVLEPGPGRVLDLSDPDVALVGLPDEDLFALEPGGPAIPVARGMGSVLFAVGVHPTTGDVWQLATEANNKDPEKQSEPAVRGDFVFNRLALARLDPSGAAPVRPYRIVELDDADPTTAGIQHDRERAVGQPYALAFDGAGHGYVTGLLTDNVTQLSPGGAFVREWDVGSIPRGLVLSEDGAALWVHCWGSGTLERWDLRADPPARSARVELGHDPTPELEREGRRLFYDAAFSLHGNASCASCHVEGGTDMLPWDLSDLPFDDKGPLVTQTLRGIADLLPFHWRGERADLDDFNQAFPGLLGGRALDAGELDAFRAFVFSLEQPANPFENPRRIVDARLGFETAGGVHHQGDAVRGQEIYFDKVSDIIATCNGCHTLPTGTNNDVVLDEPTLQKPRRNHKVVASFNGLWRKGQPTLETVVFADGSTEERPTLGSGVSSAGLKDDVKDFVDVPLFALTAQERRDVTAFVQQIDSGLAPAVHRALRLAADEPGAAAELRGYLMEAALARHCDLAVIGEVDLGAGPRALRWYWDRESGLFHAADSSVPPAGLDFFELQAALDLGANVFLGLPVGMARRFAVDADEDELFDEDELALGTDPLDPDSDGDDWPDGHELAHGGDPLDPRVGSSDATPPGITNLRLVYVTTRVAKLQFDTSEPARSDVTWSSSAGTGTVSSARFARTHTVLLRELAPNRQHQSTVSVTDHGGNSTTVTGPGFSTLPVVFPSDVILDEADVSVTQDSGGTLSFAVTARVRRKSGALGAGYQLRVEVFVGDQSTQGLVIGSASGTDGLTTVVVTQSGLERGDVVTATVRSLWRPGVGPMEWSMPDTPPELREFRVTYSGE